MNDTLIKFYSHVSKGYVDFVKLDKLLKKPRAKMRSYRFAFSEYSSYALAESYEDCKDILASIFPFNIAEIAIESITKEEFNKHVDIEKFYTHYAGLIIPRTKTVNNLSALTGSRNPITHRIKVKVVPELLDDELKVWIRSNQPLEATYYSDRMWWVSCPKSIKGSTGILKFYDNEVSVESASEPTRIFSESDSKYLVSEYYEGTVLKYKCELCGVTADSKARMSRHFTKCHKERGDWSRVVKKAVLNNETKSGAN